MSPAELICVTLPTVSPGLAATHVAARPLAKGGTPMGTVAARRSARRRVERTFDPAKHDAAEPRRLVRSTLFAWGLTDLVDDALQVTAELVANALVGGSYTVTISREARTNSVHIAVQDGRPGTPTPTDAGPESESGRGLLIIAALADEWGYSDDTVWAIFKMPQP